MEMTKREFFTAIAEGTVTEDVVAFAVAQIEKMDEANAKRKATPSKTAIENEPLMEEVSAMLTDEAVTASVIGEAMGLTVQKTSALLRALVTQGVAVQSEVKIKGKGTQKAYAKA